MPRPYKASRRPSLVFRCALLIIIYVSGHESRVASNNNLMSNKKAVILLSGGLDSTTMLYHAKAKGFTPYCLIFEYGQRHYKETTKAKRIAKRAK